MSPLDNFAEHGDKMHHSVTAMLDLQLKDSLLHDVPFVSSHFLSVSVLSWKKRTFEILVPELCMTPKCVQVR